MRKDLRPQRYRMQRIVEMVREGTVSGRLASRGKMSEELEVHRNTVLADLDCLRDDQRAPIEYDRSRHGYVLTDVTWELPPVQVSRQELFAFSVAAKLLDAFRGTPLETDMHAVMNKIQHSLEGKITIDASTLTDRFSVLGDDHVLIDSAIWAAAARSLERQERVEVDYEKFDGTRRSYLLDPYHLIAHHGEWYLLAFHHLRRRVASFALSRIFSMQTTGEFFAVPDSFDPSERLKEGFGITGGDRRYKVRLRFSPKVAAYIRHRVWHATQRLEERADGSLELTMETSGWKSLVRWVLSWQPDVKVLAPKRLRERVEEKMREGLGGGV